MPAGVSDWERVYRMLEPAQIPWNAGAADSELVRMVGAGTIAPGKAIDLGTGPGHDAILLAKNGFSVVAVDVAPTAVKLAEANAGLAEVKDKIEFKTEDVFAMKIDAGSFSFAVDRGFLHVLDPDQRPAYIDFLHRALADGGLVFLRALSDKDPPAIPPPYRFAWKDLKKLFTPRFDFVEGADGDFAGPTVRKSHYCLLRKV